MYMDKLSDSIRGNGSVVLLILGATAISATFAKVVENLILGIIVPWIDFTQIVTVGAVLVVIGASTLYGMYWSTKKEYKQYLIDLNLNTNVSV
jgi:hypothetical protein